MMLYFTVLCAFVVQSAECKLNIGREQNNNVGDVWLDWSTCVDESETSACSLLTR